jgi:hypothetical protein
VAILQNYFIGDSDEADRDDEPEPEYGVCPTCGVAHGGGFCPEPGDFGVCACGQFHEIAYCPTAAGHGMVL